MKSRIEGTEVFISKILRIGVIVSAIVIGFGLILLFATGKSGYPGSFFPTSLGDIFSGLAVLKPYALILTGLLILIITPVFRVGISIFTFLKEKDYMYVIITTIVFVILVISFLLGKVE
ncbi:DUF1634 domain-containing protein [Ruminiclostridium papyrosolvens]|uniref:Membrane protein n=1 Tax=Ruminiclostridium papyrosolvens C7 TaxID=1330534 RepID=U4R4C9_9FIRM|nr:DUF1634 domain-containing protein [Ruminiclostridium papyrosolvens]EPR13426.1 membrane protein [Ruminiclostridium papyrosolvens C7]